MSDKCCIHWNSEPVKFSLFSPGCPVIYLLWPQQVSANEAAAGKAVLKLPGSFLRFLGNFMWDCSLTFPYRSLLAQHRSCYLNNFLVNESQRCCLLIGPFIIHISTREVVYWLKDASIILLGRRLSPRLKKVTTVNYLILHLKVFAIFVSYSNGHIILYLSI